MTGFILAGGQSSRIGRDKALLPVGSQLLIELVIERIQPLVERVVVIGNPRNVQPLKARLTHNTHRILTDLAPACGPLMGIYTGLMQTDTAVNLFVPCDMPWVDSRLVERLARRCRAGAEVVASLHPCEGVQPFPLICDAKACRTIRALLTAGDYSLQALLRQPNASLIRIEEPALWRSFTNINTIADYAKLSNYTTVAR